MKKIISATIRYGIVIACIAYIFWGLDIRQLGSILMNYNPLLVLLSMSLGISLFGLQGLRFRFISGHRTSFNHATKSCLFGTGLNNIFPARIGEIGKAFYLKQQTQIPVRESLGCIFWERFSDLNQLLLLILLASLGSKKEVIWVPLACVVGGTWAVLFICAKFPTLRNFLLRMVPAKLRNFAEDLICHLVKLATPKTIIAITLYSMLIWIALVTFFGFILNEVGGLALPVPAILVVFVISSLGMSLPSSPGGLGVFEAAMVLSLGWYGYNSETALSAAILCRLTQTLPPTIISACMLANQNLSIKAIREAYTTIPPDECTLDDSTHSEKQPFRSEL